VSELIELMGQSPAVFADVLAGTVGSLAIAAPAAAGTMYRFGQA
jgi:hypothetical protein